MDPDLTRGYDPTPLTMAKSIPYRIWRIPAVHALWLALPLQIVMVWVAHSGWSQYQRNLAYRYDAAKSPPFDLDQWRYFTRHELQRSIYRALAPEVGRDALETLALTVDRRHIGELNRDLPESGRSKYYAGELEVDGEARRVKVRYMGDNHWHWLYPQKSWRIKTPRNNPIRDRRAFNLKNPPTVSGAEDPIANAIAAELGLITPDIHPIKLFVNGAYAGLYMWWDIADESLLRRFRRMPGSIYTGDGAPRDADGVSKLYRDETYWEKSGARNAEQAENRTDIQALIFAVNNLDARSFRRFAEQHIDLDQYAKFIALDRLFGGQHHDYDHNHKIYFDPYKGRFEPIEWDFAFWRLWQRPKSFDQALFPLLVRIREHPDFEARIQRELLELVTRFQPAAIHARLDRHVEDIRRALRSDGFRDWRDHTSNLRLRTAQTHCRFFTDAEFDREIERMRAGYEQRHAWLLEQLADSRLRFTTQRIDGTVQLLLESSGLVAQRWTGLDVPATGTVDLVRDDDRDGTLDAEDTVVASAEARDGLARFELDVPLYPGLAKTPERRSAVALFGTFELAPAALHYRYFIRGGVGDGDPTITAQNFVTDAPITAAPLERKSPAPDTVSFHPWDVGPSPEPRTVRVGPGVVEIEARALTEAETTVIFEPGTTVKLGEGVSLNFHGKVIAEGTPEQPIRFEPLTPGKPWGVFALHGHGTAGSRLRHCSWDGGSTDTINMVLRTGMVSIIDSTDIEMSNCFVGVNHVGDDALHWGYITGGEIRDCVLRGARSDAFDLDICEQVTIVGCKFYESGNDALDLMTSKIRIERCEFFDCGDKGVSVGEGTFLDLFDSQFHRCLIGMEIKDRSVATVDAASTWRDCVTGINLYRKNPRYGLGGTLRGTQVHVYGGQTALQADKRSTIEIDELVREESER